MHSADVVAGSANFVAGATIAWILDGDQFGAAGRLGPLTQEAFMIGQETRLLRTSSHTMRANQLPLWLAPFAYVLMSALRRIGLTNNTRLADAACGTNST